MVTLTYTPLAAQVVSGIQQDFRGANNYRPNVNGDPLVPEGERTINNWLSRTTVMVPTDPSQPFGNAERNSVRGPLRWQVDMVMSKRFDIPWTDNGGVRVPRRVLQPAEPHELPRAERQPQRRRLRHDHDDLRSADHSVRV